MIPGFSYQVKLEVIIRPQHDKNLLNSTKFVFEGPSGEPFAVSIVIFLTNLDQIQDKRVRSRMTVWNA